MYHKTPVQTYKEFIRTRSFKGHLKSMVRDSAIFPLSIGKNLSKSKASIRFPYYHHVFDDEKIDFNRHLSYMKNFGDFVSLDQALEILSEGDGLGGHYFCVTFDDGLKSCHTNGMEILLKHGCQATFFVPTRYINTDPFEDFETLQFFYENATDGVPVGFLSWKECQEMKSHGMGIGSHTVAHIPMSKMTDEQLHQELTLSKFEIEKNLGGTCDHFAAPWGDFIEASNHQTATKNAGYKSFCTTIRGGNDLTFDPFEIKRDHMIANWGNYQIKYFLSR